jgi:predicted RNA-binding Zn-ribbon protein involved in translation (DUF1610 family)
VISSVVSLLRMLKPHPCPRCRAFTIPVSRVSRSSAGTVTCSSCGVVVAAANPQVGRILGYAASASCLGMLLYVEPLKSTTTWAERAAGAGALLALLATLLYAHRRLLILREQDAPPTTSSRSGRGIALALAVLCVGFLGAGLLRRSYLDGDVMPWVSGAKGLGSYGDRLRHRQLRGLGRTNDEAAVDGVWSVVVDTVLAEHSTSVLAEPAGDYLTLASRGGITLRTRVDERRSRAAIDLCRAAAAARPLFTTYKGSRAGFPLPPPGGVRIHVVTTDGVLVADADHAALQAGGHPLSALYALSEAIR